MSAKPEGEDVRISGITFERTLAVAGKTWHVMGALLTLIWVIASYKAALDAHLKSIDDHLQLQDRRLQWLITHSPASVTVPYELPPLAEPQKTEPKPQSWYAAPKIADFHQSQDAGAHLTGR